MKRSTLAPLLIGYCLVALGLACEGLVGDAGGPRGTRQLTGRLQLQSLPLDNPLVVAQAADGRKVAAAVARDGTFTLSVPAGGSYQLLVANRTAADEVRLVSRINWPVGSGARWARVDRGAPISLGMIQGPGAEPCPAEPAGDPGLGTPPPPSTGGTPPPPSAGTPPPAMPQTPTQEVCTVQEADLPYDARLAVGQEFRLSYAFLEKGALPAELLSVAMEAGGTWRLAELQADTLFTVTQEDCAHVGNRTAGRDRIEVTWRNHDGSTTTDHLDMRYCNGTPNVYPPMPPLGMPPSMVCELIGEDDAPTCGSIPSADLPYDARIGVGMEYQLSWSFLEKGPLPARIVSVTMEAGGTWRLAELQADTKFTVTAADCEHVGNRGVARDRIEVTWVNQDRSTTTDHLDMRYCDGNEGLKFSGAGTPPASATLPAGGCELPARVCTDAPPLLAIARAPAPPAVTAVDGSPTAEAQLEGPCGAPPRLPPMEKAPPGGTCLQTVDCADQRACMSSTCVMTCVTTCGATTCTTGP